MTAGTLLRMFESKLTKPAKMRLFRRSINKWLATADSTLAQHVIGSVPHNQIPPLQSAISWKLVTSGLSPVHLLWRPDARTFNLQDNEINRSKERRSAMEIQATV